MASTAPDFPALLRHLTAAELGDLLRGYPDLTLASAEALRAPCSSADVETFLLRLLSFFLPAGTAPVADSANANGDLRLREDLGLDSLALSEAMFKIEELFRIRVENAELAEVKTLADARALLTHKLSIDE